MMRLAYTLLRNVSSKRDLLDTHSDREERCDG